jgi:hypothetical protein
MNDLLRIVPLHMIVIILILLSCIIGCIIIQSWISDRPIMRMVVIFSFILFIRWWAIYFNSFSIVIILLNASTTSPSNNIWEVFIRNSLQCPLRLQSQFPPLAVVINILHFLADPRIVHWQIPVVPASLAGSTDAHLLVTFRPTEVWMSALLVTVLLVTSGGDSSCDSPWPVLARSLLGLSRF